MATRKHARSLGGAGGAKLASLTRMRRCVALLMVISSGCGSTVERDRAKVAGDDDAWIAQEPAVDGDERPVSCHPEARVAEHFDLHHVPGAYSYFRQVVVLDDGDVVAASWDALARRRKGSAAWEALPALPNSYYPRFAASSGSTLWMGSYGATFVSLDGGETWQPYSMSTLDGGSDAITGVIPHRLGGGAMALGRDAELLIAPAPDEGGTEVPVPPLDGGSTADNTVTSLVRAGERWVASDGSGSVAWAADPLGPWLPSGSNLPYDPELVALDDRVLAITAEGEVLASFDGGESFHAMGHAAPRDGYEHVLTQAIALDDGTVVATAHGGIQLSCDGGASFETLSLPEPGESVYQVSADGEGSVWVASTYRVFRVEL